MLHGQPYYRRSSSAFAQSYSLHLLLGWVASLTLVLLLVHLPFSVETPRVGWSMDRSSERIALSEVATESPEEDESSESSYDEATPPPTRHTTPTTEPTSNSDGDDKNNDTGESDTKSQEVEQSISEVRSITSLATRNQPQMIGGPGALSLYINYPEEARSKGIEGRLVVEFTVDKSGGVRHVEVTESLHPLCDSAAVNAVRSVRFEPGKHNGQPIPVRMSLPVKFRLQQAGTLPSKRQTASTDN